jgi:hypothetical protein
MRTKPNVKTFHYANGSIAHYIPLAAFGENEDLPAQTWLDENGKIIKTSEELYVQLTDNTIIIRNPSTGEQLEFDKKRDHTIRAEVAHSEHVSKKMAAKYELEKQLEESKQADKNLLDKVFKWIKR